MEAEGTAQCPHTLRCCGDRCRCTLGLGPSGPLPPAGAVCAERCRCDVTCAARDRLCDSAHAVTRVDTHWLQRLAYEAQCCKLTNRTAVLLTMRCHQTSTTRARGRDRPTARETNL